MKDGNIQRNFTHIGLFFWFLAMCAVPISLWMEGKSILISVVSIAVTVQAIVVGFIFWCESGHKGLLTSLFPILPLTWLVEFVGSHTGIPFGKYGFTSALQPQVGGVPLLVPLAWMMMLPVAWAVSSSIFILPGVISGRGLRFARAGLAAIAFTSWDLFLDPQMVFWNFWRWSQPGVYFGIPLINYLGWLVVSFFLSLLLMPHEIPSKSLVLIYTLTWIMQSLGLAFFWQLEGPALSGFICMGCILFFTLRSNKWKHRLGT